MRVSLFTCKISRVSQTIRCMNARVRTPKNLHKMGDLLSLNLGIVLVNFRTPTHDRQTSYSKGTGHCLSPLSIVNCISKMDTYGSSSNRFAEVTADKLDDLEENSAYTRKSTNFAVNLYNVWSAGRNIPPLECGIPDLLSNSIPKFLAECRKPVESPYKISTISTIYSGLNRYLITEIDPALSLFKSPDFVKCYHTVDGLIRKLQKEQDPTMKKAAFFTPEQEQKLWDEGVPGDDTPTKLVNTLRFFVGSTSVLGAEVN